MKRFRSIYEKIQIRRRSWEKDIAAIQVNSVFRCSNIISHIEYTSLLNEIKRYTHINTKCQNRTAAEAVAMLFAQEAR